MLYILKTLLSNYQGEAYKSNIFLSNSFGNRAPLHDFLYLYNGFSL